MVLVGSLGMIILAVSIVLFVVVYQKKVLTQQNQIHAAEHKHQVELLKATIDVVEFERERIARNIHDDVGTFLNVLKLYLTKLARNPENKSRTEELLRESNELLELSIESIRGIAKDLMPVSLTKLGFEKGVTELFRQVNSAGQLKIDYTFRLNDAMLSPKISLHLFRIMQEILNNIIKHSKATAIGISAIADIHGIVIVVAHDGTGLSTETATQLASQDKGIGLKSIQSRVQLIGASIQYLIMGENSAKIIINLPHNNEENN
jgi:signal transduction histidine kinase